ncbi:MAG: cation diffusion facilitator family transporter [Crocinitomix sp.]|nr:cation diffusion facilitator family transporter [Crocinitomix sp.]
MSHNHDHSQATKNIKVAFFINLIFTVFEIIGGIYTNGIAIISDAVHDLGDSLSLGTSWYLQNKSDQKPDKKYSFDYRRFSLLGALINSVVLLAGSVYVIYEAVGRFIEPEHADPTGMIFLALVGIAVNGYAAWKLSKGKTLNEKVISWHLLEDVLGWVAILIVAIVLQFNDIVYLDPALSILITLCILWNSFKRLKETLFLFLQGTPDEVDSEKIEAEIIAIDGIASLHHTHIWSLDGEHHVFTSHVKLDKVDNLDTIIAIKCQIQVVLNNYPFEHYTIETEMAHEDCGLISNKTSQHYE